VPGEQLIESGSRMIRDAAQHIGEPGLGSTPLSLAVAISE
jgi:hypothetical protein